METGLVLALPFKRKVSEGAKGRKQVLKVVKIWRSNNPGKVVVVHSASAGEYEAAIPLIKALKKRGILTLATLFSPSGYANAAKTSIPDFMTYLPFDSKSSVKKFIDIIEPSAFIFCKHDIWPNIVWTCSDKNIPVILTNANLHSHSSRLKPWALGFNRYLFRQFTAIWTVAEKHAERIARIIGSKDKISIMGDTRFDRVVERARESYFKLPGNFEDSPVLIAGSVWHSEFFTLDVFIETRKNIPGWKLIWVPHEPDEMHLKSVESKCDEHNIRHTRLSAENQLEDSEVIIIDRTGILPALYRYADIAYVGGGFGKGVHSVIEPAVFSIPVIFGPKYHVSAEAGDLLTNGGGFTVKDKKEFEYIYFSFVEDESKRKASGQLAGKYVHSKKGVAEKEAQMVLELIGGK
jgi:3-deoxy-D-manno-octulosonic-acid transferase